jgi:hypothetical protein
VQIDQAGQSHQPVSLEHGCAAVRQARFDRRDQPVVEQQVDGLSTLR